MKRFLISIFFCVISLSTYYSQDVLYKSDGTKLTVKLVEINPMEIKYKDLSNIDGPNYVIEKSEIIFIVYANKTTEVLNSNPKAVTPTKKTNTTELTPPNKKKTQPNLYYMNSNLISINALALANGDATFIYDKEFLKNKLSISFLGGYNFNARMVGLNDFIVSAKDNAKKKYDIGFGINYMPKNTKRIQYFVGFLGKYMSYTYKDLVSIINNQKIYANASASQLGLMITNGWLYRISPFLNFKFFFSIGAPINSTSLEYTNEKGEKINNTHSPKLYLGYCFGYRF